MNLILALICHMALAANTSDVEIYSSSQNQKVEDTKPTVSKVIEAKPPIKKISKKAPNYAPNTNPESNLPGYFGAMNGGELKSKLVLSTETKQEKLLSVRAGDTARIEISHSIIAFSDEKAPVIALVKSGPLSGAKLFGISSLEKNSKRIFIEFERVSFSGSTYEIKASAITENGTQGFVGELHSHESEYFAGDFISSFVAAYFDAQVPRTTNAFGQIQDDRSVDSAFKKSLATGAMSSAERFKEKLKKAPEFSELRGPLRATLLIYEGGSRL